MECEMETNRNCKGVKNMIARYRANGDEEHGGDGDGNGQ